MVKIAPAVALTVRPGSPPGGALGLTVKIMRLMAFPERSRCAEHWPAVLSSKAPPVFCFVNKFIYLFICWLCWVFAAVRGRGLLLVAEHRL